MVTTTGIWALKPLKDITSKIGSGATPRGGKNGYRSDGISLIRSLNVYDFNFSEDNLAFISDEQAEDLDNVVVEKDDILLNITGASVARCCLVNPKLLPARVNQHVAIVRVRPDLADARFVLYCINSPHYKTRLLALAQGGATREALTKTTIEDFEICQPPLLVQKRIANILSSYDDLVENNLRRIKIMEEMARSVYREWFVNFRYPGHNKARMVKSEFGFIPEGFTIEPLEAVCRRITDGSHWSPKSIDKGIPMASVKDMHAWGLSLQDCRNISSMDYDELVRNDCKPLKGDVLIAKDGSYLKHCFWMQKSLEVVILSSIAILRPNDRIRPSYLSLHLLDPEIKSKMAGYVSGVAIPRIVLKDFRKFKVLLPPLEIQSAFSSIVEPIMQLCWMLTDRNIVLRTTRDLLLPRLISGQIDLNRMEKSTRL